MQRVHFSLHKSFSQSFSHIALKNKNQALKDLKRNISLYKWSKMTRLKLEFQGSAQISPKDLRTFLICLGKNLKELCRLSIILKNCYYLQDKDLEALGLGIGKYMRSVSILAINLQDCGNVNNKGIKLLTSPIIKSLKKLRGLSLNLSRCQNISNRSIVYLQPLIHRYLKRLESLNLDFSNCAGLTKKGISFLVLCMKRLAFLKRLNLAFENCTEIVKGAFQVLLSGIIQNLNSLQRLNLNFNHCKEFTDSCLEIFKSPHQSNRLKALSLDCKSCGEVTDQGLTNILSYLSESSENFSSLTLSIQGCDKLSLGTLGREIRLNIPTIRKLCLEINKKNYTKESFEEFTKELELIASNLQNLELCFIDCILLDEQCFEYLCSLLKSSINLKRLAFCFCLDIDLLSPSEQMTDKCVEILIENVARSLQNLEELVLVFLGCHNLTERACKAFESSQFQKIKTLKNVYLDFTDCQSVPKTSQGNLKAALKFVPESSVSIF